AREDFQLLNASAEVLKRSREELPEAARRLVAERDDNFKKNAALLQRLAEYDAERLFQSAPPSPNGRHVVVQLVEDMDPTYAGALATQLTKHEHTVAVVGVRETGQLFVAQHPSVGLDMNAMLKSLATQFGGKGGGTKDFARGALQEKSNLQKALD